MVEEIEYWLTQESLYYLEIVAAVRLEKLLVNAPVFEFHFKHFDVGFLSFVQLATISNVVYHKLESCGIPVNKYPVALLLQSMPTGKHCCQGTSLGVTER